jgi:hypothetical protein
VVAADGSLGSYTQGNLVSKSVTLPAGTTIMTPDGVNSTLTTDVSSSTLPSGTAIYEDNHTYVVAQDGSLHEALLA